MSLVDVEYLPILASDVDCVFDENDLFPIYLSDLDYQEIFNRKNEKIDTKVVNGDHLDSIVDKVVKRLEMEHISVPAESKKVVLSIISEAAKKQSINFYDNASVEEYVINLCFNAEFILLTKPSGKDKEFSEIDADTLLKQYGFDNLEMESINSNDEDNLIKVQMPTSFFCDVTEIGSNEAKLENNCKAESEESEDHTEIIDSNTTSINELQDISGENNETSDVTDNISQEYGQLDYYRLTIKSFKGDLATLNKDIANVYKNTSYKSKLIDAATKNSRIIHSENVSFTEIDEDKRKLEAIGFVTELEQFSIESNAIIDYLNKNGELLTCFCMTLFDKSISYIYDFPRMNKMNDAAINKIIRHVEEFEIYTAKANKIKYAKSGTIKLPFLGGDRVCLAFMDDGIIVSKYLGNTNIIDKAEISSVTSVFEKKKLSIDYGQLQATMKNGDVFVLVLKSKDFLVKEDVEFKNRVPFLESLLN